MLDVSLLGTGGMMPMPNRWLTALMLRCAGSNILVDCGEGTQIAMREASISPKPIDVMCFTHMHADHISGLPGMLLAMANAERTEPVVMIGPKGLFNVVRSLRCIAPELPFELRFIELDQNTEEYKLGPYIINCFKVNHNITCYGYSFTVPRKGKFNVEAAKKAGIDVRYWNALQHGETVRDEETGRTYTPDMVLGSARRGIKLTYTTVTISDVPPPALISLSARVCTERLVWRKRQGHISILRCRKWQSLLPPPQSPRRSSGSPITAPPCLSPSYI